MMVGNITSAIVGIQFTNIVSQFKSIQDQMERDPYYLFNNAMGQITPDCCQFLEDLAKCLSPDVGRTREKREKQLGTSVSTRLVFMPDFARDSRKPLDVTKEAMIAHHARLFTYFLTTVNQSYICGFVS